MEKGILFVETRPASPEVAADYHKWYDEVHLPEICAIDGFVSARRLATLDGESFIAIYEIEGDVETAKANLTAALKSGNLSTPVGLSLDPPPSQRYFRTITQ